MAPFGKIVMTSANCFTAGLLIPKLKAKGFHTIGLIRKPVPIACDEVITDWMNSDKARQALAEADHIIHFSGEINAKKDADYIQSSISTTQIVAAAAKRGSGRRVVFLSYPGADARHQNMYLRCKGQAEELLLRTGKEAVIFRCPMIVDSPHIPSRMDTLFIARQGKGVPVIGNGRQLIHPVYRGDVVDMILASLERGRPGIYELSGCEETTTDQFIRVVNRDPHVKINHIPGWVARLLSRFMKGLSPTFVDILLHHGHSSYDAHTYREFGIIPTSLTKLWSESGKSP